MKSRTISVCQGKGSIGHNNRAFHTKNTDPARTKNNIVFVREPIGDAYGKLFSAAVDRYNAKQKRSDRRINNGYFEYQFGQPVTETKLTSPDKRKSFYEYLIQLGTMEDTGVGTEAGEKATACLCEYMKGFSERNPNFYVFNAVIHLDEKTPHLHIDYIPVGHYKRGVDTQNGIAQALKEMGYGGGKNAIAKWRQSEYLVFRKICEEHGFLISEPKKSRGVSYAVEEYKEIQHEKERLTAELQPLREMELAAEETTVVGKKQLLSNNLSVSPEEFEQKKIRIVENDRDNKAGELANLRYAVGIDFSDKETDAVAKINAIKEENSSINMTLSKELNIPNAEIKKTTPLEKLHTVLDKFKSRIAERDRELDESRTLISNLKNRFKTIKEGFVKVALAINTLICSDKFSRGLTGISEALVNGISIFIDDFFKSIGEFESIDKCGLDDEIQKNMEIFIKPETTRTKDYER
ncbi:MAG: plasmid recombination protein [Oscillospiraceae bacterium]